MTARSTVGLTSSGMPSAALRIILKQAQFVNYQLIRWILRISSRRPLRKLRWPLTVAVGFTKSLSRFNPMPPMQFLRSLNVLFVSLHCFSSLGFFRHRQSWSLGLSSNLPFHRCARAPGLQLRAEHIIVKMKIDKKKHTHCRALFQSKEFKTAQPA